GRGILEPGAPVAADLWCLKGVFQGRLRTGGKVRVEIYIDCGDKLKNEQLFDRVFSEKNKIQTQIAQDLRWERLDNRRACRVAVYRDGDIDAETEILNEIRQWTIQWLLKFKEVFPPFIQRALL
ncbi:DUF4268 domain-containing protein, partial [Xanthomonas nasturtii]